MIRLHKAPNPRHACHSADVLSEPERKCQIHQLQKRETSPWIGLKWANAPHIADKLNKIRGMK